MVVQVMNHDVGGSEFHRSQHAARRFSRFCCTAESQISFNVTGPSDTTGFCNVTIQKSLLTGSPWTIKIDNTTVTEFDEKMNNTHTFLYFSYTHESPLQVTIQGTWVIPEFPSALILPLFMIATLLAVIVYKRKHSIASKCEELLRISRKA